MGDTTITGEGEGSCAFERMGPLKAGAGVVVDARSIPDESSLSTKPTIVRDALPVFTSAFARTIGLAGEGKTGAV